MSVAIRCKGEVKTVLFDEQDKELLGDLKFHINVSTGYAQHNTTKAYMHRMIMGDPKGMMIDHINRNRLDNRRSNLRIVDCSGNMLNTKPREGKQSKYIGVHKHQNGWRAKFQYKHKVYDGGVYPTEEEAHIVYMKIRGRVLSLV